MKKVENDDKWFGYFILGGVLFAAYYIFIEKQSEVSFFSVFGTLFGGYMVGGSIWFVIGIIYALLSSVGFIESKESSLQEIIKSENDISTSRNTITGNINKMDQISNFQSKDTTENKKYNFPIEKTTMPSNESKYVSEYLKHINALERKEYKRKIEKCRLANEKELRSMSWRDFEEYVARIFERNGYKCELTPQTNDGGKDIVAWKNGAMYMIECKHYSEGNSIGREIIQKLLGAGDSVDCTNFFIVTTGTYNQNAIDYATDVNNIGKKHIEMLTIKDLLALSGKIEECDESKKIIKLPHGELCLGREGFISFYIDFDTLNIMECGNEIIIKVNVNVYNASAKFSEEKFIFDFYKTGENIYGGTYAARYSCYNTYQMKYTVGSSSSTEVLFVDTISSYGIKRNYKCEDPSVIKDTFEVLDYINSFTKKL